MIIRPKYIEAMRPFIDVPLVKILAGVRRCGKSTILEMIENELLHRGISAENIIIKNYSEVKFTDFTFKDMYCDLIQSLGNKGRCYHYLSVQKI